MTNVIDVKLVVGFYKYINLIINESRNKHRFIKKNQKGYFIIIRHFILPPFEFCVYLINFDNIILKDS